MRHCKKTIKLGRKSEHRNLLLANQVCSLIEHSRIETTLAKAKAVRPFAEKMITLGKRGDLYRRAFVDRDREREPNRRFINSASTVSARAPSLDRCAEIQQPAKEHERGIER